MLKKIYLTLFLILISSPVWAAASSDVYYQAGNKLYSQGNYALCIRYYQAAIQVDPNNWKAYQAMGSCEYRVGRTNDAIRDFDQSLAINPNNPALRGFVNKISSNSTAPAMNPAAYSSQTVSEDKRLPRSGSICFEIGSAYNVYSYQDLITDYAPATLSGPGTPYGAELDLGADYTLSPNFQLGAQFQFIQKQPETVSSTETVEYDLGSYYTVIYSEIYTEACAGGVAEGKYLLPLGDQFRLILGGQVGFYTLVGTTAEYEETDETTAVYNLSSSAPGAFIGAEIEWVLGGIGLDFGLGYRALTFSSITASASGSSSYGSSSSSSSEALKNASGNANFTMDFSGPRFNVAARFF